MNCVTERVTVEVGGFSSGKYYSTRLVKYDESEEAVEEEAKASFEAEHGKAAGFGEHGTSVATDEVPTYEAVWVEVGGYMRGGKPVKGHMARRYKRVVYEPEVTHETDKTKDTRGGERRGRWK